MKEYAKDFYKSDAWKKARVAVIKRANGLCERCRAAGQYKPGVIVHHKKYITPGNIHDARVTLDLNNLEYVCEDCHNKEHKAKPNSRYTFDAKGNLLPPKENKQQTTPPRYFIFDRGKKNRGRYLKKTLQGRTYMRGVKIWQKIQKLRRRKNLKGQTN